MCLIYVLYRDASAEVFRVLNDVDPRIIVERASVDEAFLDVTRYCQETYDDIEDKDAYLDQVIAYKPVHICL